MLRGTPILIAPLLALLLSGCIALGEPFSEADLVGPPDQARVIVFRTKASLQYALLVTEIDIEGLRPAYCEFGGFHIQDVPPGKRELSALLAGGPKRCGIFTQFEAGRTYLFEISPRRVSLITVFYLDVPLFGLFNAVAYLPDSPCEGAFEIKRADDADALEKLQDLRRND